MRVTNDIKLYDDVNADPNYQYLNVSLNLEEKFEQSSRFEMKNASMVYIGKPIKFHGGTSYDDIMNCNYLIIKRQNYYYGCFIDDVKYLNDGVVEILYTLDVWNTYKNRLNIINNPIVERKSIQGNPNYGYPTNGLTDPLMINNPASALIDTYTPGNYNYDPDNYNYDGGLYYLVYASYHPTTSDVNDINVELTKYSIVQSGPTGGNSFNDYRGSEINSKISDNESSKKVTDYEIKYYTSLSDIILDDTLWTANGSRILSIEVRPGTLKRNNGDTIYGKISSDKSITTLNKEGFINIGNVSYGYPYSNLKIHTGDNKIEINPYSSVNDHGQLGYKVIDSVFPRTNPVFIIEGANDSKASSPYSSYTLTNTNSRSIDAFSDGSTAFYFSNRNRIKAKVDNLIIDLLGTIKKHYTSFLPDVTKYNYNNNVSKKILDLNNTNKLNNLVTTNKANKDNFITNLAKQKEAFLNKLNAGVDNLKLEQTLDNIVLNASMDLKTELNTINNNYETSLAENTYNNNSSNLSSNQAKQKDAFNSSQKAVVDNLENSVKNGALKNNDTSKELKDAIVEIRMISDLGNIINGGLSEAVENLAKYFLNAMINGVIDKTVALVINQKQHDYAETIINNNLAVNKDNLSRTQKASLLGFDTGQEIATNSLNNSYANQKLSIKNSYDKSTDTIKAEKTNNSDVLDSKHSTQFSVLTTNNAVSENSYAVDQQVSINNLNNSISNSERNTKNDITTSESVFNASQDIIINNIFYSLQASSEAMMIDIENTITKFNNSINGELRDYQYSTTQISSGDGLQNILTHKLNLYFDYYEQQDFEKTQNSNISETYGSYVYKHPDSSKLIDLCTDGGYCKTINLKLGTSVPLQALTKIENAFNNGVWFIKKDA